jgi:hypothetical protein
VWYDFPVDAFTATCSGHAMSSAITRSTTARPRNVAWREVQGMRVGYHNKDEPTDLDWSDVLAWTRDRCARPGIAKFLIVTDGGGPNAKQRSEFAKAVERRKTRTAIITGSAIARSILTAMQWFIPTIRGFAPGDIYSAFAYLEIAPADYEQFVAVIGELRSELAASAETSQRPVTSA